MTRGITFLDIPRIMLAVWFDRIARRTLPSVDESQSSEVERVLLHIGHACDRARRGARAVRKDGDDPQIADALNDAAEELGRVYRQLTQRTYYAVD